MLINCHVMPHGQLYNFSIRVHLTTTCDKWLLYFAVIHIPPSSRLRRHQYPAVIQTSLSSRNHRLHCHPDFVVINVPERHRRAALTTLPSWRRVQMGTAAFIHSKITVVTIPSPESIVMATVQVRRFISVIS